jgi:hypothetical protein
MSRKSRLAIRALNSAPDRVPFDLVNYNNEE